MTAEGFARSLDPPPALPRRCDAIKSCIAGEEQLSAAPVLEGSGRPRAGGAWYYAAAVRVTEIVRASIRVVATALILGGESLAAEFRISADPSGQCSAIEVVGELKPGDAERFRASAADAQKQAPLRRLYLNSTGGDFVSAAGMWQTIRGLAEPLHTIVRPRNECSSSCLLLLAAGEGRHVGAEATIVIHVARETRTGKPSPIGTLAFAYYLVDSGFSQEVVRSFMSLKDGQEVMILPSNARRYGLDKLHFFGGTNPPPTPGCAWSGFLAPHD